MITQKVQLIKYTGGQPAVISSPTASLSNINYVDKIYLIDTNGDYIGWFSSATHDYLQGITQLEPGFSYLVYSKSSAVFPYNLFVDAVDERIITNSNDITSIKVQLDDNREFMDASYVSLSTEHASLSGMITTYQNSNNILINSIFNEIITNSGVANSERIAFLQLAVDYSDSMSGVLTETVSSISGIWSEDFVSLSGELSSLTSDYETTSGVLQDTINDLIQTSGFLDSKIDTQITNLIDSAPETLDTLGEIAAALNNNPDIGDFLNTVNLVASGNSVLIAETSGVLHNEVLEASGYLKSLNQDTYDVLLEDILQVNQTVNATINNVSGVFRNDLDTLSEETNNHLVAASGSLHDQLVAASGSLYDYILDRPRYEFSVTPDNTQDPSQSLAFRFSGVGINLNNQDNPTLYLRRGETYHFNINARYHPFYIKTSRSTGTKDMFNFGVTNNGYTDRTIIFEVPYNAPSVLYYQCSNHAGMGGTLYTVQPSIATEFLDGGSPGSFEDLVTTTTTSTTTTGGPTSYDTTFTTADEDEDGQPDGAVGPTIGGLSFTSQYVGDSISFNLISNIDNVLATSDILINVGGSPTSLISITQEYINSGESCELVINGTTYTVPFNSSSPVNL
jgi:hypothetical protein